MNHQIRPLKSGDRAQWEVLWKGYQEYYEADLSADTDRLFQTLINPEVDGPFCLVCVDNATLLGMTQFLYHKSTWGAAPRCYLNDLYTIPEARGKRVGENLILAVGKAAEARGASQVYWMTQEFNETARKLYDRVGKLTPFIKYQL